MKRKESLVSQICLDGNNGGDYIKISQTKKQSEISCCNLEIGCSCVVTLNSQVPIEFIILLFTKFMLTGEDGYSRDTRDELKDFAKELFTYMDKEFTKERLSQIV